MRLPLPRHAWLFLAVAALGGAAAPARADTGLTAADSTRALPAADTVRAVQAADGGRALPAAEFREPAPFLLPRDREGAWLAPDRQLHFGGSLAIAASLRVEGRSRAEAIAGTFAIGVAKEIYDAALKPRRLGRGASRKDLVADLLGALAGVALIAAVDH